MNDKDTSIQEIKEKIAKFVKDRNWNEAHSPKNLSMSIAIEASELMEIFQWLSTEEAWNISNTEEFTHLKEELSDVIIYCLSLANQLNIDIATAIEDKIEKNGKKYPINNG
ncbi:nucleotide pyrophosphohydrolase [Tissierella carlieri]|uniref:Nucleotide pyrophosphohydrolase n=1 Tax=Tissierella carlieri TaxID=689904 RepID=A0ABT1S6Y1_9FIRM|nr:nucleotide pyrophosphohydrolase [Tissierella carlieri]MCQ4922228.1 nucleotide pyrophosphohydrolase [Tissierella carlieri]